MKTLSPKSLICSVALVAAALPSPVQATEFIVQTRDRELLSNNANQGWWNTSGTGTTVNGNYLVGMIGAVEYRNFFSFNLGAIPPGSTINSAELLILNPAGGATQPGTYNLWDVSTPFLDLNNNTGVPPAAIWADLGGGNNYNSTTYPAIPAPNVHHVFPLSAQAVTDLNAKIGTWFSVGGTYASTGNFFGVSSGTLPATLVLQVDLPAAAVCDTSVVEGMVGELGCELMHLMLVPPGQRCTDTPTCGYGSHNRGLVNHVNPPACQ